MAVPITHITIVHDDSESLVDLQRQLADDNLLPAEWAGRVGDYLRSLKMGIAGGIAYVGQESATDATKPVGSFTVSGLPTADQTVVVGSVTLTWKASAASEDEVTIGAAAADVRTNLAAAINAHSDLAGVVSAAVNVNDVDVTYEVAGKAGNNFPLDASGSTNITSDAFLSGGSGTEYTAQKTFSFVK